VTDIEKLFRQIAQEEARREALDVLAENAEALRGIAREEIAAAVLQEIDRLFPVVKPAFQFETDSNKPKSPPTAEARPVASKDWLGKIVGRLREHAQPAAAQESEPLVRPMTPKEWQRALRAVEKERDEARGQVAGLIAGREMADREYAALHKRLALAEGALDEIATAASAPNSSYTCVCDVLRIVKRTGRFQPKEGK